MCVCVCRYTCIRMCARFSYVQQPSLVKLAFSEKTEHQRAICDTQTARRRSGETQRAEVQRRLRSRPVVLYVFAITSARGNKLEEYSVPLRAVDHTFVKTQFNSDLCNRRPNTGDSVFRPAVTRKTRNFGAISIDTTRFGFYAKNFPDIFYTHQTRASAPAANR